MKNLVSKTHICLVGNGRMANQMKVYLEQNSLSFSHVFRAHHSNEQISEAIQQASHVWLSISDQAIESFYHTFQTNPSEGKIWVHFSGAHNSKTIFSVHPLMTFTKTPLLLRDFEKIHFVVSPPTNWDQGESFTLNNLLPNCNNSWTLLAPEYKAFYHALCVLAGNFPTILWSEVNSQLQSLSVPKQALFNYLDQCLQNFKTQGTDSLTGPLARNDISTIKENIKSLDGHPFKAIYESFVKAKGINL